MLKSSDAAANLPGFGEGTGQNVAHIGTFAIDSSVTENNTDTVNTGTLGWSFTLADTDPVLQSLAAGQTITQVYTVTITDNNGAPVTPGRHRHDHGRQRRPDRSWRARRRRPAASPRTPRSTAAATSRRAGTIAFQDLDLIDTHTASFVLKSSDAAANLPGFAKAPARTSPTSARSRSTAASPRTTPTPINTGTLGWSFTLADTDPVLQSLAAGQTITQVYTVTITDNNDAPVTQDVTVTITGVNDGPTIVAGSTTPTGGVTEDTAIDSGGNVTTRGHDRVPGPRPDRHPHGVVRAEVVGCGGEPAGLCRRHRARTLAHIGTFAIDSTVTENNTDTVNTGTLGWSFTLADNDPVLQSLAAGQTITQVYTVTIKDNNDAPVTQDVTVTITGVNDGPTIVAGSTTPTGGVTEDTAVNSGGNVTTAGTIAFQDLDLIDTHTASFVLKSSDAAANLPGFAEGTGPNVAHIGTFAIDSSGDREQHRHRSTPARWAGASRSPTTTRCCSRWRQARPSPRSTRSRSRTTTTRTVTQDVTVTITGTNDGPTIVAGSTTPTGGVTEDTAINSGGNVTTAGTIAFQDLDLIDTHTASFVLKSSDAAANLPGFAEGTGPSVGAHRHVRDRQHGDREQHRHRSTPARWAGASRSPTTTRCCSRWRRARPSPRSTRSRSRTTTTRTVTQDVTVTITGTNDVPTIVAGSTTPTGGVTEDTAVNSGGNVTTAGTITFQDLDLIDTHTASFVLKSSDAAANLPGFAEGTGRTWRTSARSRSTAAVTENNTDTDQHRHAGLELHARRQRPGAAVAGGRPDHHPGLHGHDQGQQQRAR